MKDLAYSNAYEVLCSLNEVQLHETAGGQGITEYAPIQTPLPSTGGAIYVDPNTGFSHNTGFRMLSLRDE